MNDIPTTKVLFVCMGNICRSPTAHGVFQSLVTQNDLDKFILVDSAGTHSYHTGNPPDLRSQSIAKTHGVDLSGLQARRFVANDFIEFDYVIGMDNSNRESMLAIKPDESKAHLNLMLDFSNRYQQQEVPDPYFGEDGFDLVFDMISDASEGLLQQIRDQRGI
jgi:protein-tyrosine phosphatase